LLSNLPWDVTADTISRFARSVGPVASVELLRAGTAPISSAVVVYENTTDAVRAFVDLHAKPLWGRSIVVTDYHEPATDRSARA
jgi:RNA recognition motif. (a.k.a. RRM, RBD, or RNP domain)